VALFVFLALFIFTLLRSLATTIYIYSSPSVICGLAMAHAAVQHFSYYFSLFHAVNAKLGLVETIASVCGHMITISVTAIFALNEAKVLTAIKRSNALFHWTQPMARSIME
jgi:hypothetical protein